MRRFSPGFVFYFFLAGCFLGCGSRRSMCFCHANSSVLVQEQGRANARGETCGPCGCSGSGLRSLFCLLTLWTTMWGPATFLPRIGKDSSQCFPHHSSPSLLGDVSPLQGQVQSQLLHQGRCELGCACSETSKLGFFHILSEGTCQMFFPL